MFIRYHLFYYAIAALLIVLGRYFHSLFYIFFFIYILWLAYRLNHKHVLMALFMSLLMLCPHEYQSLDEHIQGKVVAVKESYCFVQTKQGKVKLLCQNTFEYGDLIDVQVQFVDMNENSNDYAFHEKHYLWGQNVFYKAQLMQVYSKTSNFSLYHWIESHLSFDNTLRDYQRLFLLGERSPVIEDDYQALSQLSLIHLFALSGMHVHILLIILQNLFKFIFSKRISRILSFLCIGFYIFHIPMNISLYRAFFCLLLHDVFCHWFHELDVLSFLTIVFLLYNPYYIYNISFVFSFFIYFIVILTKKLPNSSFLIYLSSIPIILTIHYQIPLMSYLASLFLTPFIELFYTLCCFSLFFSFIEVPLHYMTIILSFIIQFCQNMNHYFLFSKPSLSFIILFYSVFFHLLYQLELKRSIQKDICLIMSLLISFSFYSHYKIYGEVTMIDVGQGDCTLIRLPMNQGNILIDTGGHASYDIATSTIIPYLYSIGVDHLDQVYISHDDFDHCGALDSLLKHFDVRNVVRDFEDYRRIGCMDIYMLKNNRVYLDSNDQSLIMYIKLESMNILMTGDASSRIEEDLYRQFHHLDVDVLKVSHHGSNTASSTTLFKMIEPQIAMIGVKKNNLYHHPSLEVIDRLERKGVTILRTDMDGMFHIRFYGKERYILR